MGTRKTRTRTSDQSVVNWQLVSTLPKFSSARLNRENYCFVYPLCSLGDGRYEGVDGWEIVGWTDAPWPRATGETRAIVFRKDSPAKDSLFDPLEDFEPGHYWCHGNPEKMSVRPN